MGHYDESVCMCGRHTSLLQSDRAGWDCSYVTAVELNGPQVTMAYHQEHGRWPTHRIPGARAGWERAQALQRVRAAMEREGITIDDLRGDS